MNEQTLFQDALDRPVHERGMFLRAACGDNHQLLQRIEKLLELHEQSGSFMNLPVGELEETIEHVVPDQSGSRIGPYKLLELIGEGGMGAVYMAEQTTPVRRRVALKLIKPGMDSRQVIARFEAERQALSLMDHPNIAKVLDAGTEGQLTQPDRLLKSSQRDVSTDNSLPPDLPQDPLAEPAPVAAESWRRQPKRDDLQGLTSGRPYFVMELVNGIPITQFCHERRLTLRQRLELFIPVCQAIQHAHQKGVIHRDIKPTNVLVALYDGRPVPKVIDFGVAKAMHQPLTEKTMFTGLGQIIGTLEYMSPEQAQRNQLDIDTRSDIYSLGVLLYELLTGDTPFDRQRLRSAAIDELLRIIRDEDPPQPSTRLSTSGKLASVAEHCRSQPAKLTSLMRGELDWIVMKAMEKDRDRRYGTANSLALDIEHFLNDEPVQAGPPSALYRFRKFARRNRVWLLTASVVASAVCIGLVTASWQYLRATRAERQALALVETERELRQSETLQRQRAEAAEDQATEEASLARAMNEFLIHDLLQLASAEGQAEAEMTVEPDIRLVTVLNRASERLADRFQTQPVVRAALQRTLAKAYQGLGRYEQAIVLWKMAFESEPKGNAQGWQRAMTDLNNLGQSLNSAGRLEESLEIFEQLLSEKEKHEQQPSNLAVTLNNLGFGHLQLGHFQQGVVYLERALESYHASPDTKPSQIVFVLTNLSVAHQEMGNTQRSVQLSEEAYELSLQHFGRSHPLTLTALSNLGVLLFNSGDRERGVQLIRQVWENHRDSLGDQHPDTIHCLSNLALMLHRVERTAEALPLARQAFEMHQSHPDIGPRHPQTLYSQTSLAIILDGLGESDEALKVGQQALAALRETLPADHPYVERAQETITNIQTKLGLPPQSEESPEASD